MLGVAAAADDLSRVYFVASGALHVGRDRGSAEPVHVDVGEVACGTSPPCPTQDTEVWDTEREVRNGSTATRA